MVEGSSCLLDIGRVVLGNVRVSFVLAGLGGVADEAQPGVRRKAWWAEIDELLAGIWASTIQPAADMSVQYLTVT